MTEEELIKFMKENLSISLDVSDAGALFDKIFVIEVKVKIKDEMICWDLCEFTTEGN